MATRFVHKIYVKVLTWLGMAIDIHSKQSPKFRKALIASGTKRLYHTIGNPDPHDTILTEKELCNILSELRKELQQS